MNCSKELKDILGMVARRNEITIRVLKNISRVSAAIFHSIAALTREIFVNTRREISCLRATIYLYLFATVNNTP